MNEKHITCDELEALLPGHLEGELDDAERLALERHARECARCTTLLAELSAITREAGALPDLTPSRDLWPEIEARIQAPVVSLPAEREAWGGAIGGTVHGAEHVTLHGARHGALRRWATVRLAAAAAALVAATAGITYVATTHAGAGRAAVAALPEGGQRAPSGEATLPTVRTAGATRTEQIYDQEIARLQAIVRDRRSALDTATIAVIQRNLGIIDSAIAQSRAALAADPASRFLNEQLNNVLGQKVELLRTVALLPART